MSEAGRLRGKVALVTGSATGIGRASALELAREGADVVVNYSRSEAEARQTQADCAAMGVRALLVRANCAKEDEVKELVARAVDELGGVDILVNNAGTTRFVPLPEIDELADAD